MRKRIVLMALAAASAVAQTQIDLRTQAKSVDFSAAGSTKPLKTGTTLPGTCTVGEVFFKTPAPSGANLYACATQNTWTVQGGITSQNCWADAVTNVLKCEDPLGNVYAVVQTAASGTANQWVDYISASGTPHTSQPTAASVGAVADPGSNGVIYRNATGSSSLATVDQLSGPFFCQDTGSSGAYQCNLSPAAGGYSTGSTYWFKANTASSGAASVNFNGLGAKTIKKLANQDLAAGDIKAGQWVLVTYDGTNMQMQNQAGSAMQNNQSNTITAGTQDFSGAAHTLPMKSGTLSTRPATCAVGETYFATDAAAGNNFYGCTAVNTWSVEAGGSGILTVENFGVAVGSRPAINIIPGQGLSSIMTDTGSKVNIQLGLDSAVMQTQTVAQSGSFLLCASSGGATSNYRCSLNPTAALYTAGMTLHWIPDVGGAGGATTLNVDTLGAIPVKMADGSTDPSPASIVGGQLYSIWYDGTHFRMPSTQAGGLSDPGSSGLVYRSALNTTTPAAGHSVAALLTCAAASGSGATYSCTTAPAFIPAAGDKLIFKADVANTGAATLNVNSAGVKTLKKQGGSVGLAANDLLAGQWVDLIFDGTSWQMQGQTGNGGGGDVITSPSGTLNIGGTSTNTTLDAKTTLLAQKFFGTSAPGSVAGNLPGDTFNDTANHNIYTCNAPSGTAVPACTAVTAGEWTLGGGGSMVYPGAGVAVSSGSGWNTSIPVSVMPGANTIPETDSSGVLNIPAGFSSTGPFAATGAMQAKPAAPAGGSLTEWFDSTLGIAQWEGSAGTVVATSVVPKASRDTNKFVTNVDANGAQQTAAIANADLPTAALSGVVKYTAGVPTAIGTSSTNCVHEDGSSGACSSGSSSFATLSDTPDSVKVMGTTAGKVPTASTAADIGSVLTGIGGGTANAQTVTLAPAITTNTGATVRWIPAAANTAATTVNVSGLGAVSLTKCGTTALAANDLTTTAIAYAAFAGSEYQLLNPQAVPCGGGSATNFSVITGGTNTTAMMIVSTGGGISFTGLGVVNASQISGAATEAVTGLGDMLISNNIGQLKKFSTGGTGNDGKILMLDSAQTAGMKWAAAPSGGDMLKTTYDPASKNAQVLVTSDIDIDSGMAANNDAKVASQKAVKTALATKAANISNGTAVLGTSAIASGACASAVTVAATGVLTTDVILAGFNGDPTAVTGYVPATSGMLTIIPYPTAGNVNFKVCNNTVASVTPGAITVNWRVAR